MGSEGYCLANAIFIGVVLNIVLPLLLAPYSTAQERMPPAGAASLDMKGQFMHMMVHHGQVPIMSSAIIALMVGLSVFLGYQLKPIERVVKLF